MTYIHVQCTYISYFEYIFWIKTMKIMMNKILCLNKLDKCWINIHIKL